MSMRASVFDPSSSRVASLGASRLSGQIPEDQEARPELIKCPEFLLRGVELERRTTLRILHKKGRRFESPWEPFFVGVYAHTLFYYANLGDWPRGVVPLTGAEVKAVDRIFRHGDAASAGDDCGPCWKVTSSSGRVLLFRAPSHEARVEWVDTLRQATGEVTSMDNFGLRRGSIDGKAALALARRLSRSSSSTSQSSATSFHSQAPSPRSQRRRRCTTEDNDTSELLTDALLVVEKQKVEIEELKKRLEMIETRREDVDQDEERDSQGLHGVEVNDSLIELNKISRDSGISEALSEDDDTQETDDDEEVEQAQKEIDSPETPADEATRADSSQERRNTVPDGLEAGVEKVDTMSAVDEIPILALPKQGRGSIADSLKENPVPKPESLTQECVVQPVLPKNESMVASVMSKHEPGPESCKHDSVPQLSKENVVPETSPSSQLSSTSVNLNDAAENNLIQQQAAELAEMARNLNKEDLTDSSSTRESSDDGSLTSSFKGTQSGIGIFDGSGSASNDFLQQQAMELAEIARNLQSSFRVDPKPPKSAPNVLKSASSSSSLVGESQSSFSDVTDFGFQQINSNDSSDSIFSITEDDLFFNDDEDGDIERLSEFDASDSQFLEASGFLDSIHQVMKDFIVSAQPEQPSEPDRLIISDEIIAEIRQGIDAKPPTEIDDLDEAHRQRALRSESPVPGSANGPSPKIRTLFSHAKSARDFLNGDFEVSVRSSPAVAARDLPSLLVEDTMSVVASILQSAGRDDKMLLLGPFLRVFGSRNRLSHLIRWAIEIEVASVINVATLFRSDDYASRLVSTYSKAIGSKFIRVALSDPIHQIFKLKIADMELNPHKEESLQDEAQANTNAENLMRTCQNIIDSIMKNTNYIPSSYFHICSHLNSKVISRFDGSKEGVEAEDASTLTRSVIGGFLFLRFVCPAITTPHLYGLTKQLPPPETRRILVLVTKLLFKTATGVKFGDREPQFKVLNPFIEKNSPAIQQLFANLAMSPSQDIDECFASDSRKIYSHVPSSKLIDDLVVIRSVSEKNLEEIEKKLESCSCAPDVSESFKAAVLNGADSLQKSSLTKKFSANMKFLSGFGKKPRKQSDV
ncbi:Ras GTPase-activating protein 1 [Phytophthora boehmeriae]|uniref:Ras GTPase-activating protein 1 n=1 Tax=Phytophthora boehmeriae TaxID=109152 RepID=A0A8T1X605_9STRA|nr:Ras GTPase-activating protein 1 [Phytophthora boehmeriae]